MATNYVQIFDDTVIKQSIKQGTEAQRLTDTLGMFTIAELAYTRDTARVFSGDYYNNNEGAIQTEGGTLVGNKYLGMIDSRRRETGILDMTVPLNYETTTLYGSSSYEEALLGTKSIHKLDNGNDDGSKEWDRTTGFNADYSAYNGDFVYDKFQNALVLFDNRIVPRTGPEDNELAFETKESGYSDGVGPTPFVNFSSAYSNTQHLNSFGNGYVIFKNIIPDNETLQFKQKDFSSEGKADADGGYYNYNNNVLEVKSMPMTAMTGTFTTNFNTTGEKVDLSSSISGVNSITGLNYIYPNVSSGISFLKVGSGSSYMVFGNNAINFNSSFDNYNTYDSFVIGVEKTGSVTISGNSVSLYSSKLINLSGIASSSDSNDSTVTSENRSSYRMLDEPIPLAWTPNSTSNVNSLIKNLSTGGHLGAVMEFKLTDDNVYCARKYMFSNELPSWDTTNNIDPLSNPYDYFLNEEFATTGKGFYLWNTGLMVRGNNSFATLANISDEELSSYACVDNNPNLYDYYNSTNSVIRKSFVGYPWPNSSFTESSSEKYTTWVGYLENTSASFYFTIKEASSGYYCYKVSFLPYTDIDFESEDYDVNDDEDTKYYTIGIEERMKSLYIDGEAIFENGVATAVQLATLETEYGFTLLNDSTSILEYAITDDGITDYTSTSLVKTSGYILSPYSETFYTYKSSRSLTNPFYNHFNYEIYTDDSYTSTTSIYENLGNSQLIARNLTVELSDGEVYVLLPNEGPEEITYGNIFPVESVGYILNSTTYTTSKSDLLTKTKIGIDSTDSNTVNVPSTASAFFIEYQDIIEEEDDNGTITETIDYIKSYFQIIDSYYQVSASNIAEPSSVYYNGITFKESLSEINSSDLSSASSVVLSLEANYSSNEDVAAFNAYKFDRLKTPSSGVYSSSITTDSTTSYTDAKGTVSSSTFSISEPSTLVNASNQFIENSDEIKLTSKLFEVPVDDNLFNLRLANINYPGCTSGNTDTLILKLVGYRI